MCLIQVLSGWQHGNPLKADSLSPGLVVTFYNPCLVVTLRYNDYFYSRHTKNTMRDTIHTATRFKADLFSQYSDPWIKI